MVSVVIGFAATFTNSLRQDAVRKSGVWTTSTPVP